MTTTSMANHLGFFWRSHACMLHVYVCDCSNLLFIFISQCSAEMPNNKSIIDLGWLWSDRVCIDALTWNSAAWAWILIDLNRWLEKWHMENSHLNNLRSTYCQVLPLTPSRCAARSRVRVSCHLIYQRCTKQWSCPKTNQSLNERGNDQKEASPLPLWTMQPHRLHWGVALLLLCNWVALKMVLIWGGLERFREAQRGSEFGFWTFMFWYGRLDRGGKEMSNSNS